MVAEQFAKIMKASGAVALNIGEVLPARPFLEAAGEYLGARMVFLEGSSNVRRCLTPDLTIAACLARIHASDDDPSGRFWYSGNVFRESEDESLVIKRRDIGMELIGEDSSPEAHLGMCDLWWRLLPGKVQEQVRVYVDDRDMFAMLLEDLAVAGPLRRRLLAAYNRPDQLRAMINGGMEPRPSTHLNIAKMAVTLGVDKGMEFLANWVNTQSDGLTVGRSLEEICDRLWMLGELEAAGGLDESQTTVLTNFLALECPMANLPSLLAERQIKVGGRLLELIKAYAEEAGQMNWEPERLIFRPANAERLDYYSGFSFQAVTKNRERVFAGGRYDGLMEQLGGTAMPAYGGSINLDVLEALS